MSSTALPSLSGPLLTLLLRREARVSLNPVDFIGAADEDSSSFFRKTLMTIEYQPCMPAQPEAVPPPPASSLSGDAAPAGNLIPLDLPQDLAIQTIGSHAGKGMHAAPRIAERALSLFVRPSNRSRTRSPKLIRSDKPC